MPRADYKPAFNKVRVTPEYDHLLWYQRHLCGLCLTKKPDRQRLVLHRDPTRNMVGLLCRRCLKDLRRWRQAVPPFASLRAQLGHDWTQRADVWLGRTQPLLLSGFQPPRLSFPARPCKLQTGPAHPGAPDVSPRR